MRGEYWSLGWRNSITDIANDEVASRTAAIPIWELVKDELEMGLEFRVLSLKLVLTHHKSNTGQCINVTRCCGK